MTKPISEWTDDELVVLEGTSRVGSGQQMFSAEVLRLRGEVEHLSSVEAADAMLRDALARTEKAEAELARVGAHNGECGTCDGWHWCCEIAEAALKWRACPQLAPNWGAFLDAVDAYENGADR